MLYHLFEWFRDEGIKFPGSSFIQFITSRVLLAVILSLVISALFGKQLINYLLKSRWVKAFVISALQESSRKEERQRWEGSFSYWRY
jgi:phospho-N-acetylmuramoyl-pentapeptide-transferase